MWSQLDHESVKLLQEREWVKEDGHISGLRRVPGMAAECGFLASRKEEKNSRASHSKVGKGLFREIHTS